MKRLFIYLLLTIICFFGFSMGVRAEYRSVCQYKSNNTIVRIFYDGAKQVNGPRYKFEYSRQVLDKDGNFSNTSRDFERILYDERVENKDGKLGDDIYSYAEIGPTTCPKNIWTFNDSSTGKAVCFYNDNVNDCKNLSVFNGKGVSISGGRYSESKVEDFTGGKTCKIDFKLGGSTETTCSVVFGYEPSSGNLIITKDNEIVKGTTINCNAIVNATGNGSSATRYHKDGTEAANVKETLKKTIHLENTSVGLPTTDMSILISNRTDFDKKFIKKWKEAGVDNCGSILYYDEKGDLFAGTGLGTDGVDRDFYILFDDAYKLCLNDKCGNVDAKGFSNLEDFDSLYDWPSWYNKENEYNNCESLIGDKITAAINDILLYVRILIPLLLIGLGVADFVKAMISPDETAMKKAQNKFIKRLLIAAVIFLIPSLVNLLFDLVNGVWAHINNSACNIWN